MEHPYASPMAIYLPRGLSVVLSSLQLVITAQLESGKQSTSSPSVPGAERATKLSFLTCAASGHNIEDFKQCFTEMRKQNGNDLLKSDALLYAPSIDDIKRNCEYVSLKCYTEELRMVLDEEQIINYIDCIFEFDKKLTPPLDGCPVCETYPLKNITIFLERLDTLLQKLVSGKNG